MTDIVDVAWKVARAFEHLGVAYYLGGSVASSLQATARSTNDIDFVVELSPSKVTALATELGTDFVRVNARTLDVPYLDRWARELAVEPELGRARAEAVAPR